MQKVVIIGANGQLGSELVQKTEAKFQVTGLNHQDIDVKHLDSSRQILLDIKPDIIINTAAYHNVPKCEQNPQESFAVNSLGALHLAQIAEEMHIRLVHYSTDYVFDGTKGAPYIESDQTNPLNIYALTKRDGEILILNNCAKHYVIRISGIYGNVVCRAKGGNFITTMRKAAGERDIVKVVDDEILTPTPVSAIVENTLTLIEHGNYGLYHMTCEGQCSWFEFAQVIFSTLQLDTPLTSCSVQDFPSPVKRPTYSVLHNKQLEDQNINIMPHWQDALITFLNQNNK